MKYQPPTINDQSIWVPIVVKNRDFLVGYVLGMHLVQDLLTDALRANDINIDLRGIDLCLDSSRFNDILENDKRESKCTDIEMRQYYENMVRQKLDILKEKHPDNDKVFQNCFLELECPCGLGIYIFNTPEEVPSTNFTCQQCGRTIIDYTDHDDNEYAYDGSLKQRRDKIIDSSIQKWESEQIDRENDDQ